MFFSNCSAVTQKCVYRSLFYNQRRYRVKKKWATNRKEKTPCQLALGHFDTYYPPMYQKKWPSIRLALLSQHKYCALVNNFADTTEVEVDLISSGADDMIKSVRSTDFSPEFKARLEKEQHFQLSEHLDQTSNNAEMEDNPSRYGVATSDGEISTYDPKNVHQYMPVQKVMSEMDELLEAEVNQSIYRPTNIDVRIIDDNELRLPHSLKAFVYPKGDVTMFSPPSKDDGNKLSTYLMDASSLLPVISLDIAPGDNVLDLCAAPGGKSLAILQTLLPDTLTCVDHSYSRLGRLKEILQWYTPQSFHLENKVQPVHADAIKFCLQNQNRQFNKILLDVPCYTDRHILHQEDNNIFRRSRLEERLQIQNIQKGLLVAALKLLPPGGTLVYSTCTLSMPQNDGAIQAALEEIWQTTNSDVAVVSTAGISDRFRDIFDFHQQCRLGQLVIPNVRANFGPLYFSKLRKLK